MMLNPSVPHRNDSLHPEQLHHAVPGLSSASSGFRSRAFGVIAAALIAALFVGPAPALAVDDQDPQDPPDQPPIGCLNNVTGSVSAWPATIAQGQSTTISWNVNAGSCSVTKSISGIGTLPTSSGSRSVAPSASFTYTLTARVAGGSATKTLGQVYVKVLPPPENNRQVVVIDSPNQVEQFINAIATPNTTVRLHASLDLSGQDALPIERGVHILGNRSSKITGPRLYTTTNPGRLFVVGEHNPADNVLISGIRIDGGNMGIGSGDSSIGISIFASLNVDIGNCEIYGWTGTAVEVLDHRNVYDLRSASTVRIHDNYIHHNRHWGEQGYGVKTNESAHALIERNVFDYNRHALASTGAAGTSYRAYNNLVLSGGGENLGIAPFIQYTHQFDVHGTESDNLGRDAYTGQAGEYFDFRYNTLTYTKGDVLKLRGMPTYGADVAHNVFDKEHGDGAVSQTYGDNLRAWGNWYDMDADSHSAACDFDGDGQADDFWPTGANWWFKGAVGHWNYLNTSTKLLHELTLDDFNGDGRCDVMVNVNGKIFSGGRSKLQSAGADAPVARTSLVWTQPGSNGTAKVWLLDNTLQQPYDVTVTTPERSKDFQLLGTGDFNADGATDLLWRDRQERAYADGVGARVTITLLDAYGDLVETSGISDRYAAHHPITTQLAGIGDFNADGRSDILWSRPVAKDGLVWNQMEIWFAGESKNRARASWNNVLDQDDPVHPWWKVRGVGDFNGDGYSDILWRTEDGQVSYWYMRHNVVTSGALSGGTDPNHVWDIQAIGDFDADGRSDLLWRATNGVLAMWFRGLYEYAQGYPTWQNWPGVVVGQEWQIQNVSDFNADGRADIVWRSSWGAVSIWLMSGASYIGESCCHPMDTSWQLRGVLPTGIQRMDLQ